MPATEPDYRLLFEALPSPFLVLTPTLEVVAVNEAYLRATQRTRAELLGRHIFDAFPDNPDDAQATGVRNLGASLQRVLDTRSPDTMAIQKYDIPIGGLEAGHFEERYWSPLNVPVLDAQGEVAFIVHRVEDVTDVVKAQTHALLVHSEASMQALEIQAANERLRVSQERALTLAREHETERARLEALLDAAPVAIWVVDAQGRLVRSNSENRRLLSGERPIRPGDTVVYGRWRGRWADGSARHGQAVQPREWPLARALRGERVQGDVIEIEAAPGQPAPVSRRVVLVSAAPIQGASGGAVLGAVDITERIRIEGELREAHRRKDEFLAMLAHELRNPLAPIAAAADLLSMSPSDPDRVRRTSEIIARQVRHMTAMVDELLDVSRVTRGLVTLDVKVVDIKRVVLDAVEQVRPLIEARGHQLTLDMTEVPCHVRGDEKRLVQVLSNLLNNAARYTPPGGQIRVELRDTPGALALAVADTGVGMTAEFLRHAFDLFSQAQRPADRSQGGLGIGLALVRRLVELHGGTVTAHSAGLGQGSRLTVTLPRAVADADESSPETPGPLRASRPLNVLVVDDNVDAANMLGMLIQSLGHRVSVEHSSARALERAKREAPDVCLLDIGLPEMDGYAVAQSLRQNPGTAGAYLVAVTGYGQVHDREAALRCGFDEHLVKPVNSAVLAKTLHAVAARLSPEPRTDTRPVTQ